MQINNYSGDRAIEMPKDDQFQRSPFAKRVAKSILDRNSNDCLVIGIYGAWGEGKTSVLNLINSELKITDVITIIFNPWRFKDEETLILNFLNTISAALNKELESRKEKFGKFLEKFGTAGGIIGVDVSKIGISLSNINLEDLKNRVDSFLQENNTRVVIFIDDIDRLDKQEIYSIFKLVKLTADFSNTTYILSFDENMVANAIGDRYGEGNQKAGFNFLEKIIQVSLQIPLALPIDLKRYCINLVENVLSNNKLIIKESEKNRFARQFENVLIKLRTPRLAVRYANNLTFSLPLLNDEANLIDLMLIEAIKTFYPVHYEFVKNNPYYFIGSYSNSYTYERNEEKKNDFKQQFEKLNEGMEKNEVKAIKEILVHLFPTLNEVFANMHYSENTYASWYKEKKIASSAYFHRYFTYSVAKGDLSDIEFNEFILNLRTKTPDIIKDDLIMLIDKSSTESFIRKLQLIEDEFDWNTAIKLSICLVKNGNLFPNNDSFLFFSPLSRIAKFLSNLLKNQSDNEESFKLAVDLLKEASSFEFAFKILIEIHKLKDKQESFLTQENIEELNLKLLKRLHSETAFSSVFEFSDDLRMMDFVFNIWKNQLSSFTKIDEYLEDKLKNNRNTLESLLNLYTPTVHSTGEPSVFKTNFSQEYFDLISKNFDINLIHNHIIENYKDTLKSPAVFLDHGEGNNIENIIRQFSDLYYQFIIKEGLITDPISLI